MKKIDICVGTDRSRNLRVRLSLLAIDDDTGSVLSERFHSGGLAPGDDPQALRTAWDAHLSMTEEQNGIPGSPWPKIPDAEWNEVLAMIPIVHTPERIAKRREDEKRARLREAPRAA